MKQLSFFFFLLSFLLTGCGKQVFTGKHEARGVWVTRFDYTNERLRHNPDSAKARIRQIFENARKARLNMIFFQVRGNGDAFYRSSFEPWSQLLTDTLGKDPGWDPLQFAVEEAHRLGLELHAWVNTFPIWRGGKMPIATTPPNPYFAHPEWQVCDSSGKPPGHESRNNEYVWASPGIPAVRQYVVNVVLDIVSKYDVDGIHFDYIRYPEDSPRKGYSHDSASVARFNSVEGNPYKLSWEHWQREQVNQFVFEAYNAINAAKPWVKVSASVIGKYMGRGWTSYNSVYQDPRRWMEVGKIDFIVPMVYWEREHPTNPFGPLITQWQDRVAYDRFVYPGISTGLIRKFGWEEIAGEVDEVRAKHLPGVVFFSASGLEKSWAILGAQEFPYWANVPRLVWKDSTTPKPPSNLTAEVTTSGVHLRWQAPDSSGVFVYNIYRSSTLPVNTDDVYNLITITGRGVTEFLDEIPFESGSTVFYAVSTVDRMGNESPPAPVVRVRQTSVASK